MFLDFVIREKKQFFKEKLGLLADPFTHVESSDSIGF
jgi:hypothetical protein